MKNALFYAITVLIWGSTWLAIKFQLGTIDPMVSVAYRFALAAVILLLWCALTHKNMRFSLKSHFFIALQGIFLFALNYWLFYVAELHITSGLAAVIFSTIMIMNMINGAIFLGAPFDGKVITGGLFGLCGIGFVFKPELTGFHLGDSSVRGLLLCLGATYLASLGNILSARNQKEGLPIIQTNAYGMTYGAILMLGVAFFSGKTFDFLFTPEYMLSITYLSVFGSIIAFGCYLTLVGRIGADRAAYATLLFPIVALAISTIWEDYQWSTEAITGVALILFGNLMMLKNKPAVKGAPPAIPPLVRMWRMIKT